VIVSPNVGTFLLTSLAGPVARQLEALRAKRERPCECVCEAGGRGGGVASSCPGDQRAAIRQTGPSTASWPAVAAPGSLTADRPGLQPPPSQPR
jgi:hypothetical protein